MVILLQPSRTWLLFLVVVLCSVVQQHNVVAFTATLPVAPQCISVGASIYKRMHDESMDLKRQIKTQKGKSIQPTLINTGKTTSSSSSSSSSLYSTWSNGQAVQGYQDFLSSGKQEIELTVDTGSVFIYGNPTYDPYNNIINAFLSMGRIGQHEDVVLSSSVASSQQQQQQQGDDDIGSAIPELPETLNGQTEYPIYICIPPTQLGYFLDNLSPSFMNRIDEFVFFSGGFEFGNIEDVLKERGMCRETMTQVLISGMKVTNNNEVIDQKVILGVDAVGEDKLAGECTACGKWAGSIASRLNHANVFCRTEFYREWRRKMWERSIYDAVFHLIGVVRSEPTTLSNVATYYTNEVSDMVWEFSQLLRGWRAITLTYGFEERLLGFGESAGSEQGCLLPEELFPYIWGSPVFLESRKFVEYLNYAQSEMKLIPNIALPQKNDEDYTSSMRQGNLRADGVV